MQQAGKGSALGKQHTYTTAECVSARDSRENSTAGGTSPENWLNDRFSACKPGSKLSVSGMLPEKKFSDRDNSLHAFSARRA